MAAIYEWTTSGRFINYEFVLISLDNGWTVNYIGYDYDTDIYTAFGELWVGKNVSVVTDNVNVLCDSVGALHDPSQYIYRGHAFTKVATGLHGGNNPNGQMAKVAGQDNKLYFGGVNSFGWGLREVSYSPVPPYSFSSTLWNEPGNRFKGIADLNIGNNGFRGYGDHFIAIAQSGGGKLTTYTHNGSFFVKMHELAVPAGLTDLPWLWGWDPQTGEMVTKGTPTAAHLFEINFSTGFITYIGAGSTINVNYALTVYKGFVISAESDSKFRVYSKSGGVLALVSTYTMPVGSNFYSGSMFETSRMSGRLWFMNSGPAGINILDVSPSGILTILFSLKNYTIGSTGYFGRPIQFLDAPLTITPNGFAGIKAKLFECWEMSATGSVNRVGSQYGVVFTPSGAVPDRVGVIGNAADFGGASALVCTDSAVLEEMRATDDFTLCFDFLLDNKTTTQQVIGRGRLDYSTAGQVDYDFSFFYSLSLNRFVFEIRSVASPGATTAIYYTVIAADIGSPTAGVKYHVCMEYNKTLDEIHLKVNDGADNKTVLPLGTQLNMFRTTGMAISIGRRTSTAGQELFMDGWVDQVFWFWDILTDAEKTWMYNGGNSRAYSEL